jgi:excisionase family DNA binding protein
MTKQEKEVHPMSSQPGPLIHTLAPRWYSPAEVGVLLGFGLSKVKMKIATGELRSIKDGKYRRILPEWVDEYIQTRAQQQQQWWAA